MAERNAVTPEKVLADGTTAADWKILRHLGRSRLSDRYLAFDRTRGSHIQIEHFFSLRFSAKASVETFVQAIQKGRFSHPHVLSLLGASQYLDRPLVQSEWVEGVSLRSRLALGAQTYAEICRIGLALASALADAHKSEVLHLGLSPDDILCDDRGKWRLSRVGLLRWVPRIAAAEGALAEALTPDAYVAPEQFRNEFTGAPADVWGLGCVLFELACGVQPYQAKVTQTIAMQVTSSDRPPRVVSVREAKGGEPVPPALAELIARCLQKAPAQRPTAGEVAKFFAAEVAGQSAAESAVAIPFFGLRALNAADAQVFFAREAETSALSARLHLRPRLVLAGPRGAGKSSLIFAGLCQRLSQGWRFYVLSPGRAPLARLAQVLEQSPEWGQALSAAPESLAKLLEAHEGSTGRRPLLIVDDLHELLYCEPEERRAFLRALVSSAKDPSDSARVLFVVLPEALKLVSAVLNLTEADLGEVVVLAPPDATALKIIAERSLAVASAKGDRPSLVSDLVESAAARPEALSTLEFALTLLWEKRDRVTNTLFSEEAARLGQGGALAQYTEAVTQSFSPEEQPQLRALLFSLVDEHRLLVPALVAQMQSNFGSVYARLLDAHLVRLRPDGAVVLASAALVHEWAALDEWLTQRQSDATFLQKIHADALAWVEAGAAKKGVLRGAALAAAEERVKQALHSPTKEAARYLAFSRQAETSQRRMRRAAVVAVWVFLSGFAVAALGLQQRASLQRNEAEKAQEALRIERAAAQLEDGSALVKKWQASGEGGLAADSGVELLQAEAEVRSALEVTDSALGRMLWAELSHRPLRFRTGVGTSAGNTVLSVAPGGDWLATASGDNLTVLDARTLQSRLLRLPDGFVPLSLQLDSDGQKVRALDDSGKVVDLADSVVTKSAAADPKAATDSRIAMPPGVRLVAWSVDGQHLAVATANEVFALDKAGTVLQRFAHAATALAVREDGKALAIGGAEGDVRVVAVAAGEAQKVPEPTLRLHTATVTALALSADGKTLLSAAKDRTFVRTRFSDQGKPETEVKHSRHVVTQLVLSTDSRFVTLEDEGTLRGYDGANVFSGPAHAYQEHRPEGPSLTPVSKVAATNGGNFVVVRNDGALELWSEKTATLKKRSVGPGKGVLATDVRGDGRVLALGMADGTTHLWDLVQWQEIEVLSVNAGPVKAVRLVDSRFVVTGHGDGKMRVWTLGGKGGAKAKVAVSAPGDVALAFSGDGKLGLSAGSRGPAQAWKLTSGQGGRSLPSGGARFLSAAMSRDGGRLITGDSKGRVMSWEDKAPPQTLATLAGPVTHLGLDPQARRVVAIAADAATLIDTETPSVKPLVGLGSNVRSLAFSSDGKLVIGGAETGALRLWRSEDAQPYWRAELLVPPNGSPRPAPWLMTQAGWIVLSDNPEPSGKSPTAGVPNAAWQRAAQGADLSAAASDGSLICLSKGDKLEAWQTTSDQRLFQVDLQRPNQIAALPDGCVTRTGTQAGFFSAKESAPGQLTNLSATANAIATAGNEPTLIEGDEVVSFTAGPARGAKVTGANGAVVVARSSVAVSGNGALANGGVANGALAKGVEGDTIVVGFRDGRLLRLKPGPPMLFTDAATSSLAAMVLLPNAAVAAADDRGFVGIWDSQTGRLLRHAELYGRPSQMIASGSSVWAANELGAWVSFDVAALAQPYCELMREIWSHVPARWAEGHAVLAAPGPHVCRQ